MKFIFLLKYKSIYLIGITFSPLRDVSACLVKFPRNRQLFKKLIFRCLSFFLFMSKIKTKFANRYYLFVDLIDLLEEVVVVVVVDRRHSFVRMFADRF